MAFRRGRFRPRKNPYANPVDHLTITAQPSTVHAVTGVRGLARDAAFTFTVEARDSSNVLTLAADGLSCVFSIQVDPQTSGAAATLGGTVSVTFANGIATSTNLTINKENTTTVQLRAARGAITVDCTAFCVYHPVFDTAPYADADRKFGASCLNTVGPNGLRTCVPSDTTPTLVETFNDPLSTTISWTQATDDNCVTLPAWNAACVFGANDFYLGDTEAVAACNYAGDTVYMLSVADIVDRGSTSPAFILEMRTGANGFWFGFLQDGSANETLGNNDARAGVNAQGWYDHNIAEGTPAYCAVLMPRNSVSTLRVGANTGAGTDTSSDAAKPTNMTECTLCGRVGGSLHFGADASNPNLWSVDVYSASKESSATAWRSALGTALGLSL